MQDHSTQRQRRFAIIGAGMAGILSAIKLADAGHADLVIYEKADRMGGTWRENTDPGIARDVPSHLYSYSAAVGTRRPRHPGRLAVHLRSVPRGDGDTKARRL